MSNIVTKPGFEGAVTPHWLLLDRARVSTLVYRSGSQSMEMRTRFALIPPPPYNSDIRQTLKTIPGVSYKVDFWVRNDLAAPGGGAGNRTELYCEVELVPGSGTWTRVKTMRSTDAVKAGNPNWFQVGSVNSENPSLGLLASVFTATGQETTLRFFTERFQINAPFPVGNRPWFIDDITILLEAAVPLTEVGICNIALTRVGVMKTITSLADSGNEANMCNLFYEHVVEKALKTADWNFARTTLQLTKTGGTPPEEWGYEYAYPADCLRPIRIADGLQVRRADQAIPFVIAKVGGARVIHTDIGSDLVADNATLVYVCKITDETLFPPSFADYIAWLLAAEIAFPLTKDKSIRDDMEEEAQKAREQAFGDMAESEQEPPEPESSFISARD